MNLTHAYDADGLNTGSRPRIDRDALITPVENFFTRSHAPAPIIDASQWRLEVDGLVERPARYSLAELIDTFSSREIAATLVCAGLRRAELLELGPLPGELPWQADAAGTGLWRGVALADLLRAAGLQPEAAHVEFTGLDRVERNGRQFGFGGSIDIAKALSDEVILATHLNGTPLPREQGYPMRVVVPGWIGARHVKWLGRITVRTEPSDNYFQARAYRVQREVNPMDPRDVTNGVAMTAVPLNAVIVDPGPGSVLTAGTVHVRGWAIGSGGRSLRTIEVTAGEDGEWVPARIIGAADRWTWTFWEATLQLEPGSHLLCVRATDAADEMPRSLEETWNVKGYGNNAWHRVRVEARQASGVAPRSPEARSAPQNR
jgi:sulfite oxidase